MSAYDEALSKIFEERLRSFYTKYDASKLASVDTILIKYKGKEEALFKAMVKKYGPEPTPEEMDDDDDDGDDDDDDDDDNATASPKDPAAEADDAIAEEEEEGPDEEEAEAARPPGESPLYCSICGVLLRVSRQARPLKILAALLFFLASRRKIRVLSRSFCCCCCCCWVTRTPLSLSLSLISVLFGWEKNTLGRSVFSSSRRVQQRTRGASRRMTTCPKQ